MKAIFFSPFANIWEHALPEALVAKSLRGEGFEVKYLRCDSLFEDFCVAMSAAGLVADSSSKQKQQVCNACHKRRDLIDKHFDFDSTILESFLTQADFQEAKAICAEVTSENWTEINFRGVPLGRYAAYEFVLRNKLDGKSIPPVKLDAYKKQLEASILTYISASKYLSTEMPNVVFTSNRLYSGHHSFVAAAESLGISNYSIQGGDHIQQRNESVTLYKGGTTQLQLLESKLYDTYSEKPLNSLSIQHVKQHLLGLMDGASAFAYSSEFEAVQPNSIRSLLNIPSGEAIALVTMSSEDEYNAAILADLFPDLSHRQNLFENQLEWLESVIEIAINNPEKYFVIRLHPRMYPNKRELVMAPIVERIQKLLQLVPSNVKVNTPDQNLSIYDLLQITAVLLNYGSTVGLEFAAYGIPVVSPASRYFYTYPENIHSVAATKEEYQRLVINEFNRGWDIENSRRAFRWMNFLFSTVALDLSENINSKPINLRPKKPGLWLFLWKKLVFIIVQFGPLVRERLSLRKAVVSSRKQKIIFDVISQERNNIAESPLMKFKPGNLDAETSELHSFFKELCDTKWKKITEVGSLAENIRFKI